MIKTRAGSALLNRLLKFKVIKMYIKLDRSLEKRSSYIHHLLKRRKGTIYDS